jgi:hypothetical protein
MLYCRAAPAQVASRFNVLITEVFPDPTPVIGLPQSEFIELKNVSATPFNLKDWRISDGNSSSSIPVNFILQPDSVVILCTSSAAIIYGIYGSSIGISNFPALDNDADLVSIRSKEGYLIHAISYNKAWYQNDLKSNGGWTLEIIDTNNPCAGSINWKASADPSGGTPGKRNSSNGNNPDGIAPALLRTHSFDSITIIAVFDETIDSLSASLVTNYHLNKNIQPVVAIPIGPLFTEVILKFKNKLISNTVYDLTAQNISDCSGNTIGIRNKAKAGLPVIADTSDIAINEILFNPKHDGFDFVEFYNKSRKIFDLKELFVANRNATGILINIKQISGTPLLFFPEDHVVITENTQWLNQNYIIKNPENIIELSALPSLPDDKGTIVITNLTGTSIEELKYDSKWHFALIDNDEGISLERIDYHQPANHKDNWTSAASTAGFATPGYRNSQFKVDQQLQGMVSASPKVFSPDNDGYDDFATIQYQMTTTGYVANITIFDVGGRAVKYLVKNATLALQGSFRWDGLDDKLQQLPVGIYIVFTEVFDLKGKTKRFKNALTLARKF